MFKYLGDFWKTVDPFLRGLYGWDQRHTAMWLQAQERHFEKQGRPEVDAAVYAHFGVSELILGDLLPREQMELLRREPHLHHWLKELAVVLRFDPVLLTDPPESERWRRYRGELDTVIRQAVGLSLAEASKLKAQELEEEIGDRRDDDHP